MLRTIWNTLREGSSRVKTYLISVFVCWLLTIALVLTAVFSGSLILGMAAAAVGIIALAVTKNMKLVTVDGDEDGTGEKTFAEKGKPVEARKKQAGKKETADDGKDKKKGKEKKADTEDDEDEPEPEGNPLLSMTEEKLKKLRVKYKVKQEHVPVMIDLCVSKRIKQCPGFAWMDGSTLKILLIEAKSRLVEVETARLREIVVEKGIAARASTEYPELRETEVMKRLFTPYLPRYHKKTIGGRTVLLKNLYVLGDDMKFTSGSIPGLLKILPLAITIHDRRLETSNVSVYYKELYTISFLWKDGIYTLTEFKEKLEQMLKKMVDADIPYAEFDKALSEMISDGLLPLEYRDYAYKLREKKNSPEQQETKKGRKKKK